VFEGVSLTQDKEVYAGFSSLSSRSILLACGAVLSFLWCCFLLAAGGQVVAVLPFRYSSQIYVPSYSFWGELPFHRLVSARGALHLSFIPAISGTTMKYRIPEL